VIKVFLYSIEVIFGLVNLAKSATYNPPISVSVLPSTIRYDKFTKLRVSIRKEGRFNATKDVIVRVNGKIVSSRELTLPPKRNVILEGSLKVRDDTIVIVFVEMGYE